MLVFAMAIVAWPTGLYGAAIDAVRLHGSPCAELLGPEDLRSVGGPPYNVAAIEQTKASCVIELARLPGRRSAASLRIEMTREASAQGVRQALRSFGGRGEPLPALGPAARRVRRSGGQVVAFVHGGSTVVIQLPTDHWRESDVRGLVDLLRKKRMSASGALPQR